MPTLSADEAEEPEDVPLLGKDLGNGEGDEYAEESENHPPEIVSLTSTPERPIAEICTQTDSKGVPVLAVIEAIATDEEGDYPLEYKFVFYPGRTILDYSQNNKAVIDNGSSPGTQLVEVTVRDSRGKESEPKSLWIVIQSVESAAASEDTGSDSATLSAGTEENRDLLNCLCRCWERGETFCSFNTTPYPVLKGGTESCGDLEKGPCMCQGAVGCWRAPLAAVGECHDRCVDLYGSPSNSDFYDSADPACPSNLGFMIEEEPNDQIGDANEIKFASPANISGRIAPAGDVDFFKFYAETPGILTVKFQSLPPEMKARIGLYGKNMNWIMNSDASNAGDLVTLKKDVIGPGWNYIAISDIDRKAHGADYTFEATFDPAPDANEPNDEIGYATYLEGNKTVTGYICPQDDVDFFGFWTDNSGILRVNLNKVCEDMKTRIALYGNNFNWIMNKDASNAGDTIILEKDISGPGNLAIAISEIDRKAHSNEYSFDFIFEHAPDFYEPNNQVGDATGAEFGKTIVGYICPIDDLDIYAFYVDASGILEVTLSDVPVDMKPRIALYSKNFNWIVNKDASNAGDTITLEKDVAETGIYYVAISDIDRKAHIDSYTMMAILKAG